MKRMSFTRREAIEEKVSLSDRFGLRLAFYRISQNTYLRIVSHYAQKTGALLFRLRSYTGWHWHGKQRQVDVQDVSPISLLPTLLDGWHLNEFVWKLINIKIKTKKWRFFMNNRFIGCVTFILLLGSIILVQTADAVPKKGTVRRERR